jgi:hypothetical protein
VTPIKPGTAARLGIRRPLSATVIEFAESWGYVVARWQKLMLSQYLVPSPYFATGWQAKESERRHLERMSHLR